MSYPNQPTLVVASPSATMYQPKDQAGTAMCNCTTFSQADCSQHDCSRDETALRYQASLVDSVADAIISTDLAATIISWNRAAATIYGYTDAEVVGRKWSEITPVEIPYSTPEEVARTLSQSGKWEGEQRHRRRDGTFVNLWASLTYCYDAEGKSIGIVGLYHDLTERKQAERLLPLAQQSEGLRLLAGGIAHDFNNILSTILSQITLGLWQLSPDSRAATHLEKAARATERAAELTRQLLAYTGQGALLVEELHLTQFIEENRKLLTTLVPSQAQLTWQLRPHSHLIKIDRGHAQQVLINLIINGAEALPLTGGTVQIETGEITLTADSTRRFVRQQRPVPGLYLYLRVSDNGTGMNPKLLDQIFDPYFSTKANGSGLGLAATLGIVRHYGGGLQVESKEGVGSTFTVLLPATTPVMTQDEHPDRADALLVPATAAEQGHVALALPADDLLVGKTILIIDDELGIREALSDLLSSEGMQILLAADGQAGITLYERHQAAIDLTLLDMKMPGMNGAQTLIGLRAINPASKVIFCSGYSEAEALRSIGQQSVFAFLQKPIEINLLLKTLRAALLQ